MSASATDNATATDPRALRDALGQFVTGVGVVTGLGRDGTPMGMTINSFSSVSLDPPLVLFSVERENLNAADWAEAPHFVVNLLRHDQEPLSVRFATQLADKWDGVAVTPGLGEVPVFDKALAVFECHSHARFDGGDHVIILGRVARFRIDDQAAPLVFFRGRYDAVASHHPVGE